MISLVAPKRNEMIEHSKMFRASRLGCFDTATSRVFSRVFIARSPEMDYTYDPPRLDYEHARRRCVPEECEFLVIGAVNQRFQPMPQETFTITSGEANGVFHRHICDYDSSSGVFVWPNRDPILEWGGYNLYGYVHNNPVGLTDPDGHNPIAIGILAGIGIGIIVYEGWHGLGAACHAQKAADDANAANAKKCLALGEMPTTPPQAPSRFRNFCVSLGLYK
jgi:RHS repeat-associated protein